jgi:hypothetical protein
MTQLHLSFLPLLAGIALLGTSANGQVASIDPPVPVPLCGPFIRENVQTQKQGHDDFGVCTTDYEHFQYSRVVTEKIYQNGSKFYCGNWSLTGMCVKTAAPFAQCPAHTCSNPEPEEQPGTPCWGG